MTHPPPSEIPAAGVVTVVIPARNAGETLKWCLEPLTPLLEAKVLREIIVVDDSSRDQTREIAARGGARVLASPRRGAAAARNAGWEAATTEWVWFIDSDCRVRDDTLCFLREAAADPRIAAAAGSYSNARPTSWMANKIQEEIAARHAMLPSLGDCAPSFNLLCRRSALSDVDGFDESLLRAQDTDLGYRFRKNGWLLSFCKESVVAHAHERSLRRYLETQFRNAFYRIQVYSRSPRQFLGDGYSSWLDHVRPILALAGLTLLGALAVKWLWDAPPRGIDTALAASTGVVLAALFGSPLPLGRRIAAREHRDLGRRSITLLEHTTISVARSVVHGLGACAGLGAVLLKPSRRPRPQPAATDGGP